MNSSLDQAERMLQDQADTFARLVGDVGHGRRGRDGDVAAALAQQAGAYAWMNHPGCFVSPELERALGELADAVPARGVTSSALPVDVLHVVTQAYPTGGSTQAVARWIDQDRGRRHAICLTMQGNVPVPDKLTRSAPGGRLVDLSRTSGGLLARGARLRALAQGVPIVVIHAHPHDVIPSIAFGGRGRPGVVTVDHADHVFWVGSTIPGVVMHMRHSGRELAVRRRGIAPDRALVMARPLQARERTMSREEAKRQLGIDPHSLLVATVADGMKYQPVGETSFVDLATALVEAVPSSLVLSAGPDADSETWAAAAARTGGRVRSLGHLPDPSVLQQACDVYVDSFPFSSLTSMLETAVFATPVVTYRGHPPDCGVLGADTPGLDDHMLAPTTTSEFVAVLADLLGDPEERTSRGERTRQTVLASHTGAGWLADLESLYAAATSRPAEAIAPPEAPLQPPTTVDVLVALVQAQSPFHAGVVGAARLAVPYLPAPRRLRAWLEARRAGTNPSPRLLASARTLSGAAAVRRRLSRGDAVRSRLRGGRR